MEDTTGHEPNKGISLTGPAIIGARTGYTPDPTAMSAGIGVMRTGKKVTVMAGTGRKATVTDATGTGVIVTAAIGTGIRIVAITADAMRRIPAITDTAGITTAMGRATA